MELIEKGACNRVEPMAYLRTAFMLLSFTLLFFATACNKTEIEQPNVILIMVDDQGYGDVGALGNSNIKTPNIDNLHSVSARFTQYHVSPTCAPTRAAILTGHHNNRAGVWHTIAGRSLILERETTMAQVFKENGYSTGIFGKWHLGDNYPFRPQDKGFEEVLINGGGGVSQTMDYWNNDYFDDTYMHNGKLEKFEGYCTDVWFENAKKFMNEKRDQPFFCYLSTNASHSPYWVEDRYTAPYKNNEEVNHAPFYGMIANVDKNIGELVDYLKSIELMDNTILIFTTDNGTAQGAKIEGHRLDGFVVKGNNAGMRGIKASMYEGGHRVPLFIHWKDGGITIGKDIDELTAHYDIFPTLVELCKLNISSDIKFDGKSLVPLMSGDKSGNEEFKDRVVIVNSQRCEVPEPWRRTALMQANWRLINGTELYNLDTDPEQRTDIAEQHPKKIEELRAAYDEWWSDISPTYSDQPYIIIGNEAENPTTLYCHDWHTDKNSPWHQKHIRKGAIDNGHWLIRVAEDGTYSLKLRRWPKESKLALNAEAPVRPAIEGTSVTKSKTGKALIIKEARIKIQDIELTKEVDPTAQFIEFTVNLKRGETSIKTWFTLNNSVELGAYYVEIEKI